MDKQNTIHARDRVVKGISTEGYFKISVIRTTDVVMSAAERHGLSPLSTVLLGRALTAALLLSSELKGEERIRLRLEGTGPVGMIVAEANRAGEVRGYVQNNRAGLDYSGGDVSLGHGLGTGLLTVSKVLYNEAEPRTSTIQLYNGNITTDVAHYLAQSEQIPSAILLNVDIDEAGLPSEAGGLLVQRLPGAPDEVMDRLQHSLSGFEPVSSLITGGLRLEEIMEQSVRPYKIKSLESHAVHFFCRCSKERFLSAMALLSYSDLKEMEGESQEVVCHFCNNRVVINPKEIKDLAIAAKAKMN